MKLFRFIIVSIFAIITFCLMYSALPAIAWVFGGSFKEIAQYPGYVAFGGIIGWLATGCIINETVDKNFRFIK